MPEFQNTTELTALATGLLCAVVCGMDMSNVVIVGDSVTALTWADTQRTHSLNARNAGITLALLSVIHEINVGEVQHIPAEQNTVCDGLSRGLSWHDLTVADHPDWSDVKETSFGKERVAETCNPFEPLDVASSLWVDAIASLGHQLL